MISIAEITAFEKQVVLQKTPDFDLWITDWVEQHPAHFIFFQTRFAAYNSMPSLTAVSLFMVWLFERAPDRNFSMEELLNIEKEVLKIDSQTNVDYRNWMDSFPKEQPFLADSLNHKLTNWIEKDMRMGAVYGTMYLLHLERSRKNIAKNPSLELPIFSQHSRFPQ